MANSIAPLVNFLGTPEVIHGLGVVDRKNSIPAGWEGVVKSVVKEIDWSVINTASGAYNFNAIDTFLAGCATAGQVGILRVQAGWTAPTYVKNLCGSVTTTDPTTSTTGTLPMYASASGRGFLVQEWHALNTALATNYDGSAQLGVVCMPGFGPFDEPAVQQLTVAGNRTALLAHGYVRTEAEQCVRDLSDAMDAVWHNTRVYLPGNPWQYISASGGINTDVAMMDTLLDYHRTALGTLGEVGNNSVRDAATTTSPLPADYNTMYSHLAGMIGPKAYQTATVGKVGDLDATLSWCISNGAARAELPAGYQNVITQARLAVLDAGLRANG